MTALQRLQAALDEETFNQVLEVLAGEVVYFPAYGSHEQRRQRNQMLLADFQAGVDIPTLAKKYDVSPSQIYKIVQK